MRPATLAATLHILPPLLILAAAAGAETVHSSWIGGYTSYWHDAANWAPEVVPQNNSETSFVVTIGDPNASVSCFYGHTINSLSNHGWLWSGSLTFDAPEGFYNAGEFGSYGGDYLSYPSVLTGNIHNEVGAIFTVTNPGNSAAYVMIDGTLRNDGVVSIQGGQGTHRYGAGLTFAHDTDLTGTGELVLDGGDDSYLYTNDGVVLTNTSTHTIRSVTGGNINATLINEGLIDIATGQELLLYGQPKTNVGEIQIGTSADLRVTCDFTNEGQLTFEPGATLTLAGAGDITWEPAIDIPATATFRVSEGGVLCGKTVTGAGQLVVEGRFDEATLADVTFDIETVIRGGAEAFAYGTWANQQTIIVEDDQTYLTCVTVTGDLLLTGPGTLWLHDRLRTETGATIANAVGHTIRGRGGSLYGALVNHGDIVCGPAGLDIVPTDAGIVNHGLLHAEDYGWNLFFPEQFYNDGQIVLDFGTYSTIDGPWTLSAGSLVVNGSLRMNGHDLTLTGGELRGTGIIHANYVIINVINRSGLLAPGDPLGQLDIDERYSQEAGGTLAIEIVTPAAGEFDSLFVDCDAELDGTLNIDATAYTPAVGDTFRILWTRTEGRTGCFATVTGGEFAGGYDLAVAYGTREVELITRLRGDMDADAVIEWDDDAAALDCLHGPAIEVTTRCALADLNRDGDVDLHDIADRQSLNGG